MNIKFQSILRKHKLKHLVEMKRGSSGLSRVTGFVADFSDSLILMHRLDWDTFQLNGYTVIREDEVSQYRFFDKAEHWQFRAVRLNRIVPRHPVNISIASLAELLTSIAQRYPLVTVHPERTKPDVCYIGSVNSVAERTVTIEDLNCNAEWTGPRRLKLADITMIDFGGGYEEALARTAPNRPTKIRRK